MRRLIKRSKTTLTSAKEKYNSLIEAWVEIDADVEVFYQKLTTAVDKSTSDYKKIAKKLRTEAYVTSTLVTVGMIIADIFGCLGKKTTRVFIIPYPLKYNPNLNQSPAFLLT